MFWLRMAVFEPWQFLRTVVCVSSLKFWRVLLVVDPQAAAWWWRIAGHEAAVARIRKFLLSDLGPNGPGK